MSFHVLKRLIHVAVHFWFSIIFVKRGVIGIVYPLDHVFLLLKENNLKLKKVFVHFVDATRRMDFDNRSHKRDYDLIFL
jgi:hypothetical protein